MRRLADSGLLTKEAYQQGEFQDSLTEATSNNRTEIEDFFQICRMKEKSS